MKNRLYALLLAVLMAFAVCLPPALADSGISNELTVPVTPKGVGGEATQNDLLLSIFLSPSTLTPGGTVNVTVALKNDGGAAMTTPVTITANSQPLLASAQQTWTVDTLAAADSSTKTFSVELPADAPSGAKYAFTASATGTGIALSASAEATVVDAADVALSIAADDATPKQGQVVGYTITLTNNGATEAKGLELACQIQTGMAVSDISNGGALTGQKIDWTVDVPARASVTRTFKGTTPAPASIGAAYNTVATVPELNLRSEASVTVTNFAPSLTISASPSKLMPGETALFTVTLRNTGNLSAGTLQLIGDLPFGMSASGISDGGSLVSQQISWPLLELGANTVLTRTFRATVPTTATAGDTYTVTSAATGDGVNLTGSATATVYEDEPDLRIKKSVNNRTPEAGASVRYTITVTNRGGVDAEDVTITDILPAEMDVIESSISDGGSYRSGSHRIVWHIDVPADDAVKLTFRAWVPDWAEDGDVFVNRATIEDGDTARASIVVTEDAVPKTGEVETIVPAAWWRKFVPFQPAATPVPARAPVATAGGDPLPAVQPIFQEWYEKNNQLVGWLKVADQVDQPVLQAPDNDFYIYHGFDGSADSAGALFLDERNTLIPDEGDQHLLIYGHNMKNGAMFGQLSQYRSLDYLKANPVVSFQAAYDAEPTYYAVVAVLDASMDADHAEYLKIRKPNFDDEADGKTFLESVKSFSYFDIPVEVDGTDPLMTLVTCSYFQPNGRLLVVARPLREGETFEGVAALMAGSTAKTPQRASRQA